LSDTIANTSYLDDTTKFSSTYYYRVSAKDGAGNISASVFGEISTSAFEANVKKGEDTTITSDDGVVTIFIPGSAVSGDLYCAVGKVDKDLKDLTKSGEVYNGPYELVCKTATGDAVSTFQSPLKFTVLAKDAKSPKVYGFKDDSWQEQQANFDSKESKFEYETTEPQPLLVLAAQSGGNNALLMIAIGLLALILLAIGGWFILRRHRQKNDSYDSFVREQYLSSTAKPNSTTVGAAPAVPGAVVAPAKPATPKPAASPNPTNVQPPGQHTIIPSPTSDSTGPGATDQYTSPTNMPHPHSPLDRLGDK
jgi:LPXTG-motif cell wall-anchored protein